MILAVYIEKPMGIFAFLNQNYQEIKNGAIGTL